MPTCTLPSGQKQLDAPTAVCRLLMNSDDDIAERYLELDAYLRKLLQATSIARNYRLLEFLGIAKQGVRYGIRNYECALRTDAFQPQFGDT